MTGPTFGWIYNDREWTLRRPPASGISFHSEAGTVEELIGSLIDYVWPGSQDDFAAALDADEDLDIDVLTAMADDIRSIVYDPIPYASVLSLWGVFSRYEPLIHGQLLLHGSGAAQLDAYDAACLGLAYLDDEFGRLHGFTWNSKARPELLSNLGVGNQKVADSQLAALADLNAQMGIRPGDTSAPAAGSRTRPAPTE